MYNPAHPISIEQYVQALMTAALIKSPDPNDERFIRKPEVLHLTSLTRSALQRRIQAGTFPKPIVVGNRYRFWSLHAVQQWMEQQKAAQTATR